MLGFLTRWGGREWCLFLTIALVVIVLTRLAGLDPPWWWSFILGFALSWTIDVAQALARERIEP